MTPRERVLAAFAHRQTERVPIDLGGTMCSSLTRGAGQNLKAYLSIETAPEPITNPLTDSIAVAEEILELLQVDFRTVRMRGPFEQARRIRGFQQFLLDMVQDPQFTRTLLDLLTENAIGFWDAMLTEVGGYGQ